MYLCEGKLLSLWASGHGCRARFQLRAPGMTGYAFKFSTVCAASAAVRGYRSCARLARLPSLCAASALRPASGAHTGGGTGMAAAQWQQSPHCCLHAAQCGDCSGPHVKLRAGVGGGGLPWRRGYAATAGGPSAPCARSRPCAPVCSDASFLLRIETPRFDTPSAAPAHDSV